jgi:hypothetical protein
MVGRQTKHLDQGDLLGLPLHETPTLRYFRADGEHQTLSVGDAGIVFPLAGVNVCKLSRAVLHLGALAQTL